MTVHTTYDGHHGITTELNRWLETNGAGNGLLVLMIQHVSASLAIREFGDRDDLQTFFQQLEGTAPLPNRPSPPHYAAQLSIPVRGGRMALGARQGVFVREDRDTPQQRHVMVHYIGE